MLSFVSRRLLTAAAVTTTNATATASAAPSLLFLQLRTASAAAAATAKPLTAYMRFAQEKRAEKDIKGLPIVEQAKAIGKEWKSLSEEAKQKYRDAYFEEMDKHKKAQPPRKPTRVSAFNLWVKDSVKAGQTLATVTSSWKSLSDEEKKQIKAKYQAQVDATAQRVKEWQEKNAKDLARVKTLKESVDFSKVDTLKHVQATHAANEAHSKLKQMLLERRESMWPSKVNLPYLTLNDLHKKELDLLDRVHEQRKALKNKRLRKLIAEHGLKHVA